MGLTTVTYLLDVVDPCKHPLTPVIEKNKSFGQFLMTRSNCPDHLALIPLFLAFVIDYFDTKIPTSCKGWSERPLWSLMKRSLEANDNFFLSTFTELFYLVNNLFSELFYLLNNIFSEHSI